MRRQLERISVDPAVMNGQPFVAGTRLAVHRVVQIIGLYPDRTELKSEYPGLSDEAVAQVLAYAALSEEEFDRFWGEESELRLAAADAGGVAPIPGDEVAQKARALLQGRGNSKP